MGFVDNAREARGEKFSILHQNAKDSKGKTVILRAKRADKILAFYIIFHLNRHMGTGEGRGGAPLPRVLSKIFAARGGGGVPPPPLGFYLKFLTPGAPWGNRVKVFKNRKTKRGV